MEKKKSANWGFISIIGGLVLLMVAVGAIVITKGMQKEADAAKPLPTQYSAAARIKIADDGVTVGNPRAKTTIDIYEDLGCPFCGELERDSIILFKRYISGDDVKMRYHVLSILDSNFSDPYSTRAANFLISVGQNSPDQWYTIHQELYKQQPAEGGPGLTNDAMFRIAEESGAKNMDAIKKDVENLTYKDQVSKSNDAAFKAGIKQTPTVKVNGKEVADPNSHAIEQAVGKTDK